MRELHVFVEHAIGSMERPMSDADLRRKFHGLVDPVLGSAQGERVIEQCAAMAKAADVRGLTDAGTRVAASARRELKRF